MFKLVCQIFHADPQKAAMFKSDFCVTCPSHIVTLFTIDN